MLSGTLYGSGFEGTLAATADCAHELDGLQLRRYAYRWEWRPGKLPVVKLEPPSAAKNKSALASRAAFRMHSCGRGASKLIACSRRRTSTQSRRPATSLCVTYHSSAPMVFASKITRQNKTYWPLFAAVPRRSGPRRAYERVETEPGLHTFAEDAPGAGFHPQHPASHG